MIESMHACLLSLHADGRIIMVYEYEQDNEVGRFSTRDKMILLHQSFMIFGRHDSVQHMESQ